MGRRTREMKFTMQVEEESNHPVLSIIATTVYKQQLLLLSGDNSSGILLPSLILPLKNPSLFLHTVPLYNGSYSEQESSLGFEPPSWTASQVRLP